MSTVFDALGLQAEPEFSVPCHGPHTASRVVASHLHTSSTPPPPPQCLPIELHQPQTLSYATEPAKKKLLNHSASACN